MTANKHTPGPLLLIAVVSFNKDSEALVLNRPLQMVYEKVGQDYIGSDGPFRDRLAFSPGRGRFKAFAGREIRIRLADGSIESLKDHWWQSFLPDHVSVIHGSVESLKDCYVFGGGACIAPDDLAALRATYTGCVYPYWDYEKVIKFDAMRKDLYRRLFHEERRRNALIKAVRAKHTELHRQCQGGAA